MTSVTFEDLGMVVDCYKCTFEVCYDGENLGIFFGINGLLAVLVCAAGYLGIIWFTGINLNPFICEIVKNSRFKKCYYNFDFGGAIYLLL